MGKSPKKKALKALQSAVAQGQQVDLLSLYTRLGDLSKEELMFIKQ